MFYGDFTFTDHFSGIGRAVGHIFVLELLWLTFMLSLSGLMIKVIDLCSGLPNKNVRFQLWKQSFTRKMRNQLLQRN